MCASVRAIETIIKLLDFGLQKPPAARKRASLLH